MFRPLNAKCECRFQSRPTEPKIEVVKMPGHTVLYDVNSMAAVEVDDQAADDLAAGKTNVSGRAS